MMMKLSFLLQLLSSRRRTVMALALWLIPTATATAMVMAMVTVTATPTATSHPPRKSRLHSPYHSPPPLTIQNKEQYRSNTFKTTALWVNTATPTATAMDTYTEMAAATLLRNPLLHGEAMAKKTTTITSTPDLPPSSHRPVIIIKKRDARHPIPIPPKYCQI